MTSSSSSRILSERLLLRRCRLLDAARGILNQDHPHRARHGHHHRHPLPTFSLQSHHVNISFSSPNDFHTTLCDAIQQAKERVYIASLYVGPAADPIKQPKELEFLRALQNSLAPDVKIILDENRALRPVPISADNDLNSNKATTSSAKATSQAIINSQGGNIHLFQVLPSPLSSLLPNPLNEVAGVFHIKIYIIDDMLILSGANLSEEYFVDRQDRYFTVQNGGNGLVEFYGKVINVLCNHAATYQDNDDDTGISGKSSSSSSSSSMSPATTTSRQEFWQEINQLFQDKNPKSSQELLSDPDTVAICIPTFHVPKGYWSSEDTVSTSSSSASSFVGDVEATLGLLEEGAKDSTGTVQLSSAYLNPTKELITCLNEFRKIDMITAGRLSHGFKNPSNNNGQQSNKAGNVGKSWIPTVFDHLQSDAYHKLEGGSTTTKKTTVWHWERLDWTFHAKGIWLQSPLLIEPPKTNTNATTTTNNMMTEAAIVGSSNFGGRSFLRDMESNLIMVFPPPLSDDARLSSSSSIVAGRLQDEWQAMIAHSKPINVKDLLASAPPLPIHIRSLLPYIKSFF